MVTAVITQQVRDELPAADLKALEQARAKEQRGGKSYPKPEVGDIEGFWNYVKPQFEAYHNAVTEARKVRYLQDELPEKMKRRMQHVRRFRSRLSHNETMRVAAMMTRNAPKVVIPSGSAVKGQKQSRWANALLEAFGRRKRNLAEGLYRQHCDALCGDGMGVFEFFMLDDSPYDRVETSAIYITDPDTGEERSETPQETLKRTDEELRTAGLPFGLRNVDPMSVFFNADDEGACPVLIVEQKPYLHVFNKTRGLKGGDDLPKPGTRGWPERSWNGSGSEDGWYSSVLGGSAADSNASETVLTMRYYDQEWYAYIVGGKFVDGPRRHKLPGIPVFITLGMVTSSPNLHERIQGVTWGMADMELAINDLMTIDLDVRGATARPKPVVISDGKVDRAATMDGDKPKTLDLSSDLVPYLKPGQTLKDAFEFLRPRSSVDLIGQMLDFWQRSGLNRIAQGESPGSDPAGYTVNSLTQAAQSQYEVILDNFAMTLAAVVDFARRVVRDTIGDKVSLAAPMESSQSANAEWLELGPGDVDEAAAIVIIDPLSDANKIAKRQSLSQGNKEGYVSRRRVQVEGYGIDDPDQEDDQLAIDAADSDLLAMAVEEAKAQIYGRQAPPPPAGPGGPGVPAGPGSGLVDKNGAPLSSSQGATPAPLNAPSVGPVPPPPGGGPPDMNAMTALAGQGRGQAMTGGGP